MPSADTMKNLEINVPKPNLKNMMIYSEHHFDRQAVLDTLLPLYQKKEVINGISVEGIKPIRLNSHTNLIHSTLDPIEYEKNYVGNVKPNKKPFPNNITCNIKLTKFDGSQIFNIFIFKSSCKITPAARFPRRVESSSAGLTKKEDVRNVINFLYTIFVSPKPTSFILETVLTNVLFSLGVELNSKKLCRFFNSPEFDDRIHMCMCQKTSIKISFYRPKLKESFTRFFFKPNNLYTSSKITEEEKNSLIKKKKVQNKFITFLIFFSSKTIASGKNYREVAHCIEWFKYVFDLNKDKLIFHIKE